MISAIALALVSLLGAGAAADAAPASQNWTIKNTKTGDCLDSNQRGVVYTLGCNGGNYQKWYYRLGDGGRKTQIVNVATGRCLDGNKSGVVYTLGCNGGDFQNWDMTAYPFIRDIATGRIIQASFIHRPNGVAQVLAFFREHGGYSVFWQYDR